MALTSVESQRRKAAVKRLRFTIVLAVGLACAAALPLQAADDERGRVVTDKDEHFQLKAPDGYLVCGPPDGAPYVMHGFFIPLNTGISCLTARKQETERVHFSLERFWSPEEDEDNWIQFQVNCVKNDKVESAAFSEAGTMVSGLPTRRCVRVHKNGWYERNIFVRRGNYKAAKGKTDKAIIPDFYHITAYAKLNHRQQINALLEQVIAGLTILPD